MQNSAKIYFVYDARLNNACRAELGLYPLVIKIQKIAVKFYNHLKGSDAHTEKNLEKSPFSQLVLELCSQTDPTEPQHSNTLDPTKL